MAFSRRDGRRFDELRKPLISFEGLARADGSARFGFGSQAALASVSGPIEVRIASESASQATFEVLLRPLSNVTATEHKALASLIRSTLSPSILLTKHPRTLIQLVIQSLTPTTTKWKDGLVASYLNASTLAMLNAGSIPLRGVVVAIPVIKMSNDGPFVVDPTDAEVDALQGSGCFAFLIGSGTGRNEQSDCVWATWKNTNGVTSRADISAARGLAASVSDQLWKEIKLSVERMESTPPFRFDSKLRFNSKTKDTKPKEDSAGDDAKMEI